MNLSKLKPVLAVLMRKPRKRTPLKQPTKADLKKRFKLVVK